MSVLHCPIAVLIQKKELFTLKCTECVREFQAMAEYLLFQSSFHSGARITL